MSICCIHKIWMNRNKNCAQELRQVKIPQLALPQTGTSPNLHFPQLALPPTGPRPRLKFPNCRYTIYLLSERISFETRKWIYYRSWYSEIKIFDASQTWYGKRFFWWTILFFLFKYFLTIGHLTKLLAIMQTYAQPFRSHIRRQKEQ